MKRSIATVCVLGVTLRLISGCLSETNRPRPSTEAREADAPLAEELEKVRKLCPVGMSALEAKERLGSRCQLARYHGPVIDSRGADGAQEVASEEAWCLKYQTANGPICLWLSWPAPNDRPAIDRAIVARIAPMRKVVFRTGRNY
jgi:hypothetical protein